MMMGEWKDIIIFILIAMGFLIVMLFTLSFVSEILDVKTSTQECQERGYDDGEYDNSKFFDPELYCYNKKDITIIDKSQEEST